MMMMMMTMMMVMISPARMALSSKPAARPSHTTRSLVTRVSVATILRVDWLQRN